MSKLRMDRVGERMKQIISQVVTQELKDPRCGFITIAHVKVAPDLKSARVSYSVLGTDAEKRSAQRAVESARGYIQSRIAQSTSMKYTPIVTFHLDQSVEREIDMAKRIDNIVEADRHTATARAVRARIAEDPIPENVAEALSQAAQLDEFREHLAASLLELMNVDTTARSDIGQLAADERRYLQIIEADLKQAWADGVRAEFVAIDPDIEHDQAYAPPAYTAAADGEPMPAEDAYRDRANLVAVLTRGDLGEAADPDADELFEPLRIVLNTPVDTRPPHTPPTRDGGVITGAGAADAKGQAVMILGAFRLLKHLRDELGVRVREDLCAQFVIDTAAGGNGNLCLGLQDPFASDGIVICEPTGLVVWPVACEQDRPLDLYAGDSVRRMDSDAAPVVERREPSGDAAILADVLPGRDIIVFGAGGPSADRISLHDIAAGAKMLSILILESAGLLV